MRRPVRIFILGITIAIVYAAITAQWRGLAFNMGRLTVNTHSESVEASVWPQSNWGVDVNDESHFRTEFWTLPRVGMVAAVRYVECPWWLVAALWTPAALVAWRWTRRRVGVKGFPVEFGRP